MMIIYGIRQLLCTLSRYVTNNRCLVYNKHRYHIYQNQTQGSYKQMFECTPFRNFDSFIPDSIRTRIHIGTRQGMNDLARGIFKIQQMLTLRRIGYLTFNPFLHHTRNINRIKVFSHSFTSYTYYPFTYKIFNMPSIGRISLRRISHQTEFSLERNFQINGKSQLYCCIY